MSDIPGPSPSSCDFNLINRNGGTVLLRGGFQYTKKRQNKGTLVWRCVNYHKHNIKCSGSLTVKENATIVKDTPHTCSPDYAKNVVDLKLDELKKNVENFEPVPTKFNETIASLNDTGIPLVTKVPTFKSIKTSLYYNRNKKENIKKIKFNKPEDVEIPPKFKDFLIADYYDADNRILIFASEEAKNLMSILEHFFGDGTFKSCPPPFKQLYTIHGDDNSDLNHTRVIPLVYVLMTKMNEDSYKILFNLIKTVIPNWKPLKFTSDYEIAVMNAMKFTFPEVQIKGCQVHMARAIRKRAKELKLVKNKLQYRTVALCTALPLLPRNFINDGWDYILDVMNSDEKLNVFTDYMLKQWLKDEKFIDVWCVSEERHRTTNCLEGWHTRLNKKIRACNLMTVLNALKKDADLNAAKKKFFDEKRSEDSISIVFSFSTWYERWRQCEQNWCKIL